MPDKSYVLPVFDSGHAIFPVKAVVDPYRSGKPPYCAGCPALFGGNIERDQTDIDTLVREAAEESRNRINLDRLVMMQGWKTAGSGDEFECVHQEGYVTPRGTVTMKFYLLMNGFTYQPSSLIQDSRSSHREMQEQPLILNLRQVPTGLTKERVADSMIEALPIEQRQGVTQVARQDFRKSGTAEAIRRAAEFIRV